MTSSAKTLSALVDCVPDTWLDPLLTGPRAVIGQSPYTCADIEILCSAIRKRIRAAHTAALKRKRTGRRWNEAMREIIDELAAIADACVDLQQNRKRPDSAPVMGWDNAPLTLGTLRKARALKREPNAAGEETDFEVTSISSDRVRTPAPAAPDVALRQAIESAPPGDFATASRPISPDVAKVLLAAKNMDWMQVVLNGGPPCFHLQEDGRFCGRAERWDGHDGNPHNFVSLAALLVKLGQGWMATDKCGTTTYRLSPNLPGASDDK